MAARLTPQERDALFARVLLDLSEFEDLQRAIASGDLEHAYKLGRRIGDGLRLLLDGGLGFARRTAEPITLRLPHDELRHISSRMKGETEAHYESLRPDREETERDTAEITDVRDACTSVLKQIEPV